MDVRALYQEVILDHGKHPRNFGVMEHANCSAEGLNPLCGDRLTLYMDVSEGVIRDVRFEGQGCAVSTASASLMTEALKGKSAAEAEDLFKRVHAMLTQAQETPANVGKLEVLSGVRAYPLRVKCASLAWHAMRAALEGRPKVSTEGGE